MRILTKENLYWAATLLITVVFLGFFWLVPAEKSPANGVKLSLTISPDLIFFGTGVQSDPVAITLSVDNPTNQDYSSTDYFYRVVINRSYPDSPAYIIKDFSKDLTRGGHFSLNFSWMREYLAEENFKFRVHFNMYKHNQNNDPILISTVTKILELRAK